MKPSIEKPFLERDLLESLSRSIQQEKQVILHVRYANTAFFGSLIRIWKSSYLVEHDTGNRSELIHAENISFYPVWTEIPPFVHYEFTLVFSGLSKECNKFDFLELIPQSGGFEIPNIKRNKSDVYRVELIDL
ncbi:hypothetical protein [Chryseobacterium sp. A321]